MGLVCSGMGLGDGGNRAVDPWDPCWGEGDGGTEHGSQAGHRRAAHGLHPAAVVPPPGTAATPWVWYRSFVAQEMAPVPARGVLAPLQSPAAEHRPRGRRDLARGDARDAAPGCRSRRQQQGPAWSKATRSPSATGTVSHPTHKAEPWTYVAAAVPEASAAPQETLRPAPAGARPIDALSGFSGRADLSCSGVIGLFMSLLFKGVI